MKKRISHSVSVVLLVCLVPILFSTIVLGQENPQRRSERSKRTVDSIRKKDSLDRASQNVFWRSDSSRRWDTSGRRRDSSGRRWDSGGRRWDASGRFDSSYRRSDSGRARGGLISSLFADSNTLTTSDYQLQIEKTFLSLNNIENNSHLGPTIANIQEKLTESTGALSVLKDNVVNNNTALNLKNLQVFKTLLRNIQKDLRAARKYLDSNENKMTRLRSDLRHLISDTILRQVMRNDSLRANFGTQLRDLRRTFVGTTRQVRESMTAINLLQTQTSSNLINTNQLLEDIDNLETSSAKRIFGKENNYLWEADTTELTEQRRESFKKVYNGEKKAMSYYFSDNGYKTILLLFLGFLYYLWVFRNMKYLRTHKGDHQLTGNEFEYLKFGVIPSALVVIFAIAPIFDLHAPAAYIETMQFLLLCVVTYLMYKKWPGASLVGGLGLPFFLYVLIGKSYN